MPGILLLIFILLCLWIGALYMETKKDVSPPPTERSPPQVEKVMQDKSPLKKKRKPPTSRRYEYLPELPVSQLPSQQPPVQTPTQPIDFPYRLMVPRAIRREEIEEEGLPVPVKERVMEKIILPEIAVVDKASSVQRQSVGVDAHPSMQSQAVQTEPEIYIPSFSLLPELLEEKGEERKHSISLSSLPNINPSFLTEEEKAEGVPVISSKSSIKNFLEYGNTINSELIIIIPEGIIQEERKEPFFSVIVHKKKPLQALDISEMRIADMFEKPDIFRMNQTQLKKDIGEMSYAILKKSLDSIIRPEQPPDFSSWSKISGEGEGKGELSRPRSKSLNSMTFDEFEMAEK